MVFEENHLEKAWYAYETTTAKHRFYDYAHGFILLFTYEFLLFFSYNSHVLAYNGVDAWFKYAQTFVPRGTLLISLALLFYRGYYIFCDWQGVRNHLESKAERAKSRKEGKKYKYKPKSKYRPNWYYFGVLVLEGFIYGSLLYMILPELIFGISSIFQAEVTIPPSLDTSDSLRDYHTNFIQNLALAFGAGFYDEMIFRGLLIAILFRLFTKQLGSLDVKDVYAGNIKKFLILDNVVKLKFTRFLIYASDLVKMKKKWSERIFIAALASLIYTFSHYLLPFGDVFSLYSFLYRFFFGLILYIIFAHRRFAVAAWVHTFYDLWYFILL